MIMRETIFASVVDIRVLRDAAVVFVVVVVIVVVVDITEVVAMMGRRRAMARSSLGGPSHLFRRGSLRRRVAMREGATVMTVDGGVVMTVVVYVVVELFEAIVMEVAARVVVGMVVAKARERMVRDRWG